jgi:hypothetical protein
MPLIPKKYKRIFDTAALVISCFYCLQLRAKTGKRGTIDRPGLSNKSQMNGNQ